VSLPTNEIFTRMLEVLVLSVGGFLAGVVGISILRRSIVDGGLIAFGAEDARSLSPEIRDAKQKLGLENSAATDAGSASPAQQRKNLEGEQL
jgi:hypothetical protein